jgi:hypothetical protein
MRALREGRRHIRHRSELIAGFLTPAGFSRTAPRPPGP